MKINKLDQDVNRTECFYLGYQFPYSRNSFAKKWVACVAVFVHRWLRVIFGLICWLTMTSYRQFLHKTTRNYEFHQNKSNFIKTDQQIFLINFYFVLFESLHILSLNYWLNASISFCLRMRCYFRGFCVFETVRNEFIKCVVFFFSFKHWVKRLNCF